MAKVALLAIVMMGLVACGPVKEVTCNGFKSELLCTMIDGNTEQRIDNLEAQQDEQNKKIRELDMRMQIAEAHLAYLLTTSANTEIALGQLQAQIDGAYAELANLAATVANIPHSEVEIIDPCPTVNSNSPKEKLLKIGSKYVGYFEMGSKRFLTDLVKGVTYQTTDTRACIFSI